MKNLNVSSIASIVSMEYSKNAETARSGNRAEQILCTQESVKHWLSQYFGITVVNITKIEGRKKSDNRIEFEDGTFANIQNKNGSSHWTVRVVFRFLADASLLKKLQSQN